ncbi:MAG: hypothetical protein E5W81_04205 [Mesorhizobium sp.]|nr:MAG: hypothetical protein E5V36_00580 [Mesorhizobium sp.]TKB96461.1 MAG: hypothetical protein E5W81_04205 [Mesorhizobium sp.]
MKLHLPDAAITIVTILGAELIERCNHHTQLEASIVCEEPAEAVLRTIGQPLEISIGSPAPIELRLTIGRIEVSSGVCRLTAYGPSYQFDLIKRTRSFDADVPQPISAFNIEEVFQKVEGLNVLSAKCAHIGQFEETDWKLLVRLARRSGAVVVTTADGRLKVVRTAEGTRRTEVDVARIVEDRLSIEVVSTIVESVTWDWRTGAAPTRGATHSFSGSDQTIEGAIHRAAGSILPGGERHRVFRHSDAPDDEYEAKILSAALRAPTLRWAARLRNLDVAPGDILSLSGSKSVDTPMLVISRSAIFEGRAVDGQLSIEVEAISADAVPAGAAEDSVLEPMLRAIGVVVSVDDPERLGLVKVHFAWHAKESEGTWCRATQAAAGAGHGAFNPPVKGDWVITLHWPKSGELPVIVGAIYRGDAKIADYLGELSSQRAIVLTPGGQRIVADDGSDSLHIGIFNGAQAVCELVLTKDPPTIKLESNSGGTISMKAETIELEATKELKIHGKVSID